MTLAVFLAALILCAYVYFGYPALLYVLARLRPRPVARRPVRPAVSLVLPVHNEETVIEEKLRNCLGLDYPPERLELLVVSDGSTDRTEAIVSRYEPRVRLIRRPRSGKAAALDEGVLQARGEILVFTDANAMLEPQGLAAMVENFGDPEVGGVCGNKKLRRRAGADATEGGENLYWRYDKWQKGLESAIGSIFAADGAFYAVRRELYVPIADPAQADDIAVSARVVLQGRRLVFEPRAVAWEEAPAEGRLEFRRKVRVTNHSVRALVGLGRGLVASGFYSVELVSHKLLRHLVPFLLIPLFVSSVILALRSPLFGVVLGLQVLFCAAALLGFALRTRRPGSARLVAVPYYFCLVNLAAFLGVLSIMLGTRVSAWVPRSGLRAREEDE